MVVPHDGGVRCEREKFVAQGVRDLQDEGVDCTVRPVEEFRAVASRELLPNTSATGGFSLRASVI